MQVVRQATVLPHCTKWVCFWFRVRCGPGCDMLKQSEYMRRIFETGNFRWLAATIASNCPSLELWRAWSLTEWVSSRSTSTGPAVIQLQITCHCPSLCANCICRPVHGSSVWKMHLENWCQWTNPSNSKAVCALAIFKILTLSDVSLCMLLFFWFSVPFIYILFYSVLMFTSQFNSVLCTCAHRLYICSCLLWLTDSSADFLCWQSLPLDPAFLVLSLIYHLNSSIVHFLVSCMDVYKADSSSAESWVALDYPSVFVNTGCHLPHCSFQTVQCLTIHTGSAEPTSFGSSLEVLNLRSTESKLPLGKICRWFSYIEQFEKHTPEPHLKLKLCPFIPRHFIVLTEIQNNGF